MSKPVPWTWTWAPCRKARTCHAITPKCGVIRNGKWFIKDLGSQNGTLVRPASSTQFQRVAQEQPVNDGDEMAFGNARFEFRTN